MCCFACAETVTGILIRETVNLHFTRNIFTISRASGVHLNLTFSGCRRVKIPLLQSRPYTSRSLAATSSTSDDLYVPFDGQLGVDYPQRSPSGNILQNRRRAFKQPDGVQLKSNFEPELLLRQEAVDGGQQVSEDLGGAPGAYHEHDTEDLYEPSKRSKSVDLMSDKSIYNDAILELSPDNVDAVADELTSNKPTNNSLLKISDARYTRTYPSTLDAADSIGGDVDIDTTTITTKDMAFGVGSRGGRNAEPWQAQKAALEAKFGSDGWKPRKRLSPDALEGIRALNAQFPEKYTTPVLADQFKVSPEAIRRILKSKWRPSESETEERRHRWDKRGERIWSKMVELGLKPPKKWREMGIGRKEGSSAGDSLGSRSFSRRGLRSDRESWGNRRAEVASADSYHSVEWEEETFAKRIL